MRVLTLRQPWASLIAAGYKTVETRGQATKVRGRIAIHAGMSADIAACEAFGDDGVRGRIVATATMTDCIPILDQDAELPTAWMRHIARNHTGQLWLWNGMDHNGASWKIEPLSAQQDFGDFRPGRFGWILENVERLETPVPFSGGQGWSKSWEPEVTS